MNLSRRQFVATAATAAGLATVPNIAAARTRRRGPRPAVIASANGLGKPRPDGSRAEGCCDRAMAMIKQGADPLDAVIAGVNIVEDDPNDHSVGLGGLPNEDGVVELDSCVMHGPTHKAGGVAALRNIRNPSKVARLVMQRTDHVLIVGEGALRFAKAHGLREENLLTDEAREMWLRWKETLSDSDDWLPPGTAPRPVGAGARAEPAVEFTHGTINCCALTASGDLAGVTTTSGLNYKIPGRVGDSPIIGAGLYVDNEVGAAGSTGRGEANLLNLSSFMVVEFMRQGKSPEDACLEMLKRVAHKTEPRLRNPQDRPNFSLQLYAIAKDGTVGGATMHGPGSMAYHDGTAARHIPIPSLYP